MQLLDQLHIFKPKLSGGRIYLNYYNTADYTVYIQLLGEHKILHCYCNTRALDYQQRCDNTRAFRNSIRKELLNKNIVVRN